MAIQGLRHSGNFATDERPKNWREGILMKYPNGKAPLFALSAAMKSRTVDDAEFNWWEKSMQTRRVALGANAGTGTGITLTGGGNGLKVGDILWSRQSGEKMRVTSVTSDTAIVVSRSWGATVATEVLFAGNGVDPNLQVIGNVMEENSDAPAGVGFDPAKKYNYTQIFRHTLEMSRTASKTRLRTGDQVKEAKRETLELHSADIERALWFGERIETTINGNPARSTGGIVNFLPAGKIKTAGATTDMNTLEGWFEEMFEFGSDEKMAFTGNRALRIINQIVRKNTQFNIYSNEKEFGMRVTRITTPYGEIVFKTHPLFNQMTGGTTGSADYYGPNSGFIALDMANLQYVKFDGGDTQYQPKLQGNGIDGMKSGYLTECGLELHHPDTFFQVKDLKAAAADA